MTEAERLVEQIRAHEWSAHVWRKNAEMARWHLEQAAALRTRLPLILCAVLLVGCTTPFDSVRQRDVLAWEYGNPVPSWWRQDPRRCHASRIHAYNWSFSECQKEAAEQVTRKRR